MRKRNAIDFKSIFKIITLIFQGAFDGIERHISKRLNMTAIGYKASHDEEQVDSRNLEWESFSVKAQKPYLNVSKIHAVTVVGVDSFGGSASVLALIKVFHKYIHLKVLDTSNIYKFEKSSKPS